MPDNRSEHLPCTAGTILKHDCNIAEDKCATCAWRQADALGRNDPHAITLFRRIGISDPVRPEAEKTPAPKSDGIALYRWLYLFSGAVFSERDRRIRVARGLFQRRKASASQMACVCIGVGIHREDLNKVFSIFERLNPGHCAGEGLGLAIAKKSVENHGGELYVESQYGCGSTFAFTPPLRERCLRLRRQWNKLS